MLRQDIDVGGTYTDFALDDEATRRLRVCECLTTPDASPRTVLAGITSLHGTEQGGEQVATAALCRQRWTEAI